MKSYFLILLTTLVTINRVSPYKQSSLSNSGLAKSSITANAELKSV